MSDEKRTINHQYLMSEYYDDITEKMKESNHIGYPNDIFIDISTVLSEKPDFFMIFSKDYPSTHLFEIKEDYDYNDLLKYYNRYLCMYNFYFMEMDSFKTVYSFFLGKMNIYDLNLDYQKEMMYFVLMFFYEKHYRRWIHALDENIPEQKEIKEIAQKNYEKNKSIFSIRIDQIKNPEKYIKKPLFSI